jgi:predicted DNA binding CopG/RHH family protein
MKKDNEIYSKEELKFFDQLEKNYKPSSSNKLEKTKQDFEKIAGNTLKRKSINIRVFESDIDKIKAIAMHEGVPYQTFITSVLHKIATGQLSPSLGDSYPK